MDITTLRNGCAPPAPLAAGSPEAGRVGQPVPGAWVGGTAARATWAALAVGQPVTVRLDDGATVRLRAARDDDEEPLRRMFLRLSDRTRYLYFCSGVPANDIWANHFARLGRADGHTAWALVAEPGDTSGDAPEGNHEVIGLARFSRNAHGQSAEIGILLADAWQSRGLGRFVLDRLRLEARRRAVAVFTGTVLWENRRMLRLARRLFPQLQLTCSQGVCDLTITLD
jgi:RimJ/RimL family protein N-acetyltransferase